MAETGAAGRPAAVAATRTPLATAAAQAARPRGGERRRTSSEALAEVAARGPARETPQVFKHVARILAA